MFDDKKEDDEYWEKHGLLNHQIKLMEGKDHVWNCTKDSVPT